MNTPTLETERLVLRRFTEDDLGALFRIYADEQANTFLPWFAARTLDDARDIFERSYASVYAAPQGYAYAVCLKGEAGKGAAGAGAGEPIGYIKIDTDGSHDLGYGLRTEFWHRGIASEAGRALIEQARRDGLPYLTATHDVNNLRSGTSCTGSA